tara:strand:- start:2155 stop:2634 length:480 start_codon:yes stop_codon:yes gene_type:complete
MYDDVLLEVQTALAEVHTPVLDQSPVILPSVLTDYLDTLLQCATEIPESRMEHFPCLRYQFGVHEFLMPLSRIQRIDLAEKLRFRFRIKIPGCEGGNRFMLRLHGSPNWLFFDDLIGLERVESAEVIWRPAAERAPWFIGTHKHLLCRIFDPDLLIERQ